MHCKITISRVIKYLPNTISKLCKLIETFNFPFIRLICRNVLIFDLFCGLEGKIYRYYVCDVRYLKRKQLVFRNVEWI